MGRRLRTNKQKAREDFFRVACSVKFLCSFYFCISLPTDPQLCCLEIVEMASKSIG